MIDERSPNISPLHYEVRSIHLMLCTNLYPNVNEFPHISTLNYKVRSNNLILYTSLYPN